MPRLSQQKKDKIAEQILHYLFTIAPESAFTVSISRELARDEEFTRSLLEELQKKNLVVSVTKNPTGSTYLRRRRWRLSNEAYEAYKKHQSKSSVQIISPNSKDSEGSSFIHSS